MLGLMSSSIFILSSILMLPFKIPLLLKYHKPLLICALFRTFAYVHGERDQLVRTAKNKLQRRLHREMVSTHI